VSQSKKKEPWFVKDALHGILLFKNPEMCKEIMDSSCMQRLRRIKQTGFAYLVFPSAEHTRFQHSLGVAYIAGKIASDLGLSPDSIKKCEAAALLHDVGIFPFSHVIERGDFGYIHKLNHEKYTTKIIKEDEELKDILHRNSLDPEKIIDTLEGRDTLSPIINGPLDSDKLDYLQRDSYFTGVETEIDPYVYHIFIQDSSTNELCVIEKGLPNVEAVFCARYRLTQIVYYHHAVRVAGVMLNRALMDAYVRKRITVNKLVEMGDEELLLKLIKAGGYAKEFAERLRKRRLYKRVVEFEVGKIAERDIYKVFAKPGSQFIDDPTNVLRLESFLADKLRQEEGAILIDIPHEEEFEPPERKIKIWPPPADGHPYVFDRSRYIYGIDAIYKELREMHIYSKEELSEDLKKKCGEIIREIAAGKIPINDVINFQPWISQT
jgi:HD superfamily phosphohydrolase